MLDEGRVLTTMPGDGKLKEKERRVTRNECKRLWSE